MRIRAELPAWFRVTQVRRICQGIKQVLNLSNMGNMGTLVNTELYLFFSRLGASMQERSEKDPAKGAGYL